MTSAQHPTMPPNDEWLQAAAQLKSYVTAGDAHAYQDAHETTVVLDLTHSNLVQKHIEIRFDKHQTLDELRHKIYQKTGTPHGFQQLQVYDTYGRMTAEIPPTESATIKLGYYSLQHGMRIHCIDLNPNSISSGGKLEDVTLVAKYRMTDEDYQQRKNTLRSWGDEQKQQDPTFTLAKHAKEHQELVQAKRLFKSGHPLPKGFEVVDGVVQRKQQPIDEDNDDYGPDSVQGIDISRRCEVQPGGRRGTVAYVGEVAELQAGFWVGVVFDEPVGKSNGSIGDKQYFEAGDRYGGFCRGKNVQVGDFPERDLLDELDDSEDEL